MVRLGFRRRFLGRILLAGRLRCLFGRRCRMRRLNYRGLRVGLGPSPLTRSSILCRRRRRRRLRLRKSPRRRCGGRLLLRQPTNWLRFSHTGSRSCHCQIAKRHNVGTPLTVGGAVGYPRWTCMDYGSTALSSKWMDMDGLR